MFIERAKFFLFLFLCFGCGKPATTGDTCEAKGTGKLTIATSGLPAGLSADVHVIDATGASQPAKSGATVSVTGGTYRVHGDTVIAPGAIARTVHRAAAEISGCVKDGQTTTDTVIYAKIETSHALWASNANGSEPLLGFDADLLTASGDHPASIAMHAKGAGGIAFDKNGNAWVIGNTTVDPPILRYPAAAFATPAQPVADVSLDGTVFQGGFPRVTALAFDASGNLWASVGYADKVVKLSASQIAASGSPTPAAVLTGVDGPKALAFDKSGNLWVASGNQVLRYDAAHLGGASAADLTIEAKTPPPVIGSLADPRGLAFDASGNLWVSYSGVFARLEPSTLAASGTATVTPAVQVGLDVLALPSGIAFDESGALWFAYKAGKIARLSAAQLGASGDKTPEVIITSASIGSAGDVAFFPAPATLPLYHAL